MAPLAARHIARPLVALAIALAIPAGAAAATKPVKAPKSGSEYVGVPGDIFLRIASKRVEIVAFSFPCGDVWGRTSMNDFRLKKTEKGYRFNADSHGLASYTDGTDENVELHFSGRFARDAKTVRGHMRVVSPRCGNIGDLEWKGRR